MSDQILYRVGSHILPPDVATYVMKMEEELAILRTENERLVKYRESAEYELQQLRGDKTAFMGMLSGMVKR